LVTTVFSMPELPVADPLAFTPGALQATATRRWEGWPAGASTGKAPRAARCSRRTFVVQLRRSLKRTRVALFHFLRGYSMAIRPCGHAVPDAAGREEILQQMRLCRFRSLRES
jgi:hypothetical protein